MDRAQITQKLQDVFDSTFVDPPTVTDELTAKDVDEWDSLTHVSVILAVEESFGIRFRVGEVEGTKNVGDLITLIQARLAPVS